MKILFLNPHINLQHPTLLALQAKSNAVLVPETAEEAWQVLQLHGTSIELAVIHREGDSPETEESGLKLIEKIKADPQQADLPIVLTSEKWDTPDFTAHQNGPNGVHAYLKWPCSEADINRTLDEMFAASNVVAGQSPFGQLMPADGPVLEEASGIFLRPERDTSQSEIHLEKPEILEGPETAISSAAMPQMSISGLEIKIEENAPPEPSSPSVVISAEPPSEIPDIQQLKIPQSLDPIEYIDPFPATPAEPIKAEPVNPNFAPEKETIAPEKEPDPLATMFESKNRSRPAAPSDDDIDRAILSEMPYLFTHKSPTDPDTQKPAPSRSLAGILIPPMGDAIIPGGAAQSPDLETLKKYLVLREQDVAVLSAQLRSAQELIAQQQDELKQERNRCNELNMLCDTQQERIDQFEKEKSIAIESLQSQIAELQFDVKTKIDKAKLLEIQIREATQEMDRLKERVRSDIRKIRVREKELENKLEITRKDSEVLIGTRETKIIELKRKLDIVEFNMDLLHDQYAKEKDTSAKLRERLSKAAQVVRVAGGFLDAQGIPVPDLDIDDPEQDASSEDTSAKRKAG